MGERAKSDRFPPRPDAETRRKLRRTLVRWFRASARDLPWRRTKDAYAIWVSEAMLQQTRVETVVPYWERFLARFPDVESLAAADEQDVLSSWSGLGYYRRARALQTAARAIVREHDGLFPSDRAAALSLPGVGPYTAGAVLSIAYDRPEPLVDGNVVRVLCRAFGLDGDSSSSALQRELWSRAAELLPARGAGEWNQALMELGATLCRAVRPHCPTCPWSAACVARREGRIEELPRPKARRAAVLVELQVLWVQRNSRVLLERRPALGRMAGMWQLPTIELPAADAPLTGLFPPRWQVPEALEVGERIAEVRHSITHHRIRASVHRGLWRAGAAREPLAWVKGTRVGGIAVTAMTQKVLVLLN